MRQKRAYKYRIYPTDEQKRILAQTFRCCRFIYNWALRQKTDAYYQYQQRWSYKALSEMLTALMNLEEIMQHLSHRFVVACMVTCLAFSMVLASPAAISSVQGISSYGTTSVSHPPQGPRIPTC